MSARTDNAPAADWVASANARAAALSLAIAAADWAAAGQLTSELAMLLQAPPSAANAQVVPVYQHALAVIERASNAAAAARAAARTTIKQLGKGRKALSAYV